MGLVQQTSGLQSAPEEHYAEGEKTNVRRKEEEKGRRGEGKKDE
jgi:hypothetical protein